MKRKVMTMMMAVNPKMANEADLCIFDDIGEYEDFDGTHGVGPKMISEFLAENTGVDTINVQINSNGGNVFDGISVLNLLKSSGKKVNVEIIGLAASIASVIAMAGHVKMHPTSQMMIHNCWTWAVGNANDFRKLADDMDKIMESSKIAYLEKAGDKLSKEKLQELLDGEAYLTAQECFEYGLCDEIIGKEEPKADMEVEQKATLEPKEKIEPLATEEQEAEEKAEVENQPSIEPIQNDVNWFF